MNISSGHLVGSLLGCTLLVLVGLAIVNIFRRTGHGRAWIMVAVLPLALVASGVFISLAVGTSAGFVMMFPIPLLLWSGLICKLGFSGWPKTEDTSTLGGRSE